MLKLQPRFQGKEYFWGDNLSNSDDQVRCSLRIADVIRTVKLFVYAFFQIFRDISSFFVVFFPF